MRKVKGGATNVGIFRAVQSSIAGTRDIFFQGLPDSTAGYTYIEDWSGAGLIVGTGAPASGGGPILFRPKRTLQLTIPALGGLVVGAAALATTATDGFLYIPSCAGTPTGVPTAQTGTVAMVYDSTNDKLYIYNGSWKRAQVAAVDAVYA